MNQLPDFRSFFHDLWGHDPFPWRAMLADRVAATAWPKALDPLTASGKTACLDVAVHALASRRRDRLARPARYRVSYRRVLEIQTRLLARVVTGELPRYLGFETR